MWPNKPPIPIDEVLNLFRAGRTYPEIRDILWRDGEGALYHLGSIASLISVQRKVDPTIPYKRKNWKQRQPRTAATAAHPIEGMAQRHKDVLQALIDNNGLKVWEVEDIAGYSKPSSMRSLWELRRVGLIEKISGRYVATEKGKIVHAINVGKASRARRKRFK